MTSYRGFGEEKNVHHYIIILIMKMGNIYLLPTNSVSYNIILSSIAATCWHNFFLNIFVGAYHRTFIDLTFNLSLNSFSVKLNTMYFYFQMM